MRNHRSRRSFGVIVAIALVVSACSSGGSDSAPPDGEVDASVQTYGGIEQISVTDLPADSDVVLVNPDGETTDATTDAMGSIIFRDLAPGDGYTVTFTADGEDRQTDAITVLDESDTPAQSFYDDQELVEGLNYITMRDGVELAATVRLPQGLSLIHI